MLFLILSATLSKNFPQADATEIEGKMRNRLKLIRRQNYVSTMYILHLDDWFPTISQSSHIYDLGFAFS